MTTEESELEALVHNVLSGEVDVEMLNQATFEQLLAGLQKLYLARVLNCVDASAKYDQEWMSLSCIFARVLKQMSPEREGKEDAEDGK